jgi:hypothetical protein
MCSTRPVRRVPPSPGTASLADLRLLWGRLNQALPPHASARRLIIPHSQGTGEPAVRQRAATMSANHRLQARHIRFRVLTMNVAYVLIFGDAQQISRGASARSEINRATGIRRIRLAVEFSDAIRWVASAQ